MHGWHASRFHTVLAATEQVLSAQQHHAFEVMDRACPWVCGMCVTVEVMHH
jgi:hypothetical protein